MIAPGASPWRFSLRSIGPLPCGGGGRPAAQCPGGNDHAGEGGGRGDQDTAVGTGDERGGCGVEQVSAVWDATGW